MTHRAGVLLLVAIVAAGAAAQRTPSPAAPPPPRDTRAAEDGPGWSSLSKAQQQALAPLRAQWSTLDAPRKNKWITVAQRFPAMPEAERQRVQARMAEWARMSPSDRGRARQNFQELRTLPAEDRQALWEAYRALPEERRQQLAQKATAKPAAEAASGAADNRRKVATAPRAVQVRPVTPTVVQAKPGGTTTLLTKPAAPPVHHQPGMPKILAGKDFVNPHTLLPSRGPQGAATVAPASAPTFVPLPEQPVAAPSTGAPSAPAAAPAASQP